MDESMQARLTVLIHAALAVLMGIISPSIDNASRALVAIVTGIVVLFAAGYVSRFLVGKRSISFWIGNGVVIYLFFWLVAWAVVFNL